MVMDLIRDAGTPQPPSLTSAPSVTIPSSPPTPGSAASESVFQSDDSEGDDVTRSKAGKPQPSQLFGNKNTGRKQKSHSVPSLNGSIHKELYECQESLIPFKESDICSDSDSEPMACHPLSTSLQEDVFMQHMDKSTSSSSLTLPPVRPRDQVIARSDMLSSCVTLPRVLRPLADTPAQQKKKKRRIGTTFKNLKARTSSKSKSLDRGMNITQPSQPEREDFGRKWTRRTAVRKNRRKTSTCLSPSIPESSYAFQVSIQAPYIAPAAHH